VIEKLYPDDVRDQITELDLSNCPKLNKVYCYLNQLTKLELGNELTNLTELSCYGNNLTNCDFVKQLNQDKLTFLSIRDNNFVEQNLEVFSKCVNLETLRFENTNKKKIDQGIYNRFTGSPETLRSLDKLKNLHISNTDIEGKLEHLSKSLEKIVCSSQQRPESKVKEIEELLKKSENFVLVNGSYMKTKDAQQ